MLLQFDGQEFLDRFTPRYKKLSNCVKTIVLPDGRIAQMQIVITTDESDFCTKVDTMSAIVDKIKSQQ